MYSQEEKAKIDDLRRRAKDHFTAEEQNEDFFLMRWLRARNMNVDKAEEMLKNSLQWRKETGADTILEKEDFPDKYKKRFMFGLFGEDEEGCSILLLPAGRHNHRMLIENEGMEATLRWNIVWMEKVEGYIREARQKTGKPIYTYHEIIDMEHYSLKAFTYKPAVDYILETQKMFDANYPDILKTVTVINAPKMFALLFSILKPLIDKNTLDKVSIFGSDEDAWKKRFIEKGFPMHKFPPRWGGTLLGSDEFCSQESCWIEFPIPLEYFREVPEEDEDGFFAAKVGARDKLELKLPTDVGATKVYWKFKTEGHDIGFQLRFLKDKDVTLKEEVLIPMKRVESQKQVQEDSITINDKGVCIFLFDNRYSMTKSKSLKYHIVLTKAE